MTMVEATQKKLRETQFFLQQLSSEGKKVFRSEPEAFHFYLSAFLSAGRSVTWSLQSEEKEKYDAWFPDWFSNRPSEDRELFNFLKTQRNFDQKRGRAEMRVSYEYVPMTEVQMPAGSFFLAGVPGTPPPQVGRPAHHFKLGESEVEVTETCKHYANVLQELLSDFLKAHP